MSTTLEALQAEVLRLSPADRARLLDRLIASLDVDSEAEAAWDDLGQHPGSGSISAQAGLGSIPAQPCGERPSSE